MKINREILTERGKIHVESIEGIVSLKIDPKDLVFEDESGCLVLRLRPSDMAQVARTLTEASEDARKSL